MSSAPADDMDVDAARDDAPSGSQQLTGNKLPPGKKRFEVAQAHFVRATEVNHAFNDVHR